MYCNYVWYVSTVQLTYKVTSARVKLARNSRATRTRLSCACKDTRSRVSSSIQQNPVKITNCWVGENVNDWTTLHSSASILFRKMRSIDRNGGRVRLAIYIVLGELRLNIGKMRHKIHCKDRLQVCNLLAIRFYAGTCRSGSRSSMQKTKNSNKNDIYV